MVKNPCCIPLIDRINFSIMIHSIHRINHYFDILMEEIYMLTNEQLKACKEALLKRQTELIQHMRDHYGTNILATEAATELSSYDNHPADMGSALFERGKDLALHEHSEKRSEEHTSELQSRGQ